MFDYKTMKMPNGDYYNVKVKSSYTDNTIKEVKNVNEIKRDVNECLSFFHQFLML